MPSTMNNKQSLVEKAKEQAHGNRKITKYTKQELELAIAWVENEITFTQVGRALNAASGNGIYSFLALCLKQIMREAK